MAVRVCEYAVPTLPAGSDDVVILGASLIVTVYVRDPVCNVASVAVTEK